MFTREMEIAATISINESIDTSINPGKFGFETLEFRKEGRDPFAKVRMIYSISRNTVESVEVLSGEVGHSRDWHKLDVCEDSEIKQFFLVSPITTVFRKIKITYKEDIE